MAELCRARPSRDPAPPRRGGEAGRRHDGHPTRKEYRAPSLTVYGSVRDLTRGVGIGKPDNGFSGSHSKVFKDLSAGPG